jgi:hypothetical protein
MSTPMSQAPRAPMGSRRLTWFLVAGLAIAGVTIALVFTLSGSKSPSPVKAVPAPAAASAATSPVPQATPYTSRFEHGMPYLNPTARRTTPRHSTASAAAPKTQPYAPNTALRKEGLARQTGR